MMNKTTGKIAPAPRAVIFDMDGVLVDSEALHWESVGDLLGELLGDEAPELSPRIGWSDEVLWAELRDRFDLSESVSELTGLRDRHVARRLKASPPAPMPGALEAVRRWRDHAPHLPLAVASASTRAQIDLSLLDFTDQGGEDLFTIRRSGVDDVSLNKPRPDVYLATMAALGLEASECWIAEDSMTGITAALASGAWVFAVGAHSVPLELRRQCHGDMNSLCELYDAWARAQRSS